MCCVCCVSVGVVGSVCVAISLCSVYAGKTKLLDRIRRTNVQVRRAHARNAHALTHIQGGEAGGITQQIGATYFPLSTLIEQV
jgi:translation initiation factor 5B